MSTDRDLLELAAKAAGLNIVIKEIPHRTLFFGKETVCKIDDNPCKAWNPLDDDGDALRLAVMLDIGVFSDSLGAYCNFSQVKQICVYFSEIPDIFAATRRAIVRAAAEIGKSMS